MSIFIFILCNVYLEPYISTWSLSSLSLEPYIFTWSLGSLSLEPSISTWSLGSPSLSPLEPSPGAGAPGPGYRSPPLVPETHGQYLSRRSTNTHPKGQQILIQKS